MIDIIEYVLSVLLFGILGGTMILLTKTAYDIRDAVDAIENKLRDNEPGNRSDDYADGFEDGYNEGVKDAKWRGKDAETLD